MLQRVATGVAVLVVAGFGMGGASAASPELTDRAGAAGINYLSTPSWDVCTADWNNDGNEDFHLSLHMKNAGALFANNGDGTLFQSPEGLVSPKPTPGFGSKAYVDRHACAWADVDNNGLQDLYNAAGRWASNKYKDEGINNELYLQTAPGQFQDVATQAGVGEPCSRNRFPVFADFNGDGWMDLYVSAQKERADSTDVCNTLPDSPYNEQTKIYINLGDDQSGNWQGFRTAPEYNVSQPNNGNRLALSWDEDGDGRPDLLAQTFANNRPFFFRNNGNGFTEISRAGVKRFPAMNGAAAADINGDGYTDLVIADNNGFGYLRGGAGGINVAVNRIATIPSTGDGWTVAVGDINGDGLMDIYGQTKAATKGAANPDDYVYVQQPNGSFVGYTAPSAGGDANDVAAIVVNGRAQFIVVNGGNDEKEAPGPVQMIAWNE